MLALSVTALRGFHCTDLNIFFKLVILFMVFRMEELPQFFGGQKSNRQSDDERKEKKEDDIEAKVLKQIQMVILHLQVAQVSVFDQLLHPKSNNSVKNTLRSPNPPGFSTTVHLKLKNSA
jgi:hypothetical protein